MEHGVLGFYDGNTLCGFVYLAHNSKIMFVMFLAVDKALRSKGYGSAILQGIKNKHPEKKIVISIEPCDKDASDIELRIRRKNFYMRNGYQETGYMMKLNGIVQEIIITNSEFDKKQFRTFLQCMAMALCGQEYGNKRNLLTNHNDNSIMQYDKNSCQKDK